MKMMMIGCGGAAPGSIVEDHPAGTKIIHKLEKGVDIFSDLLVAMIQMGNSELERENRHGIAENQVTVSIEDSFLTFREMIQTEETRSLLSISFDPNSHTTCDPFGIVLQADGKSSAR